MNELLMFFLVILLILGLPTAFFSVYCAMKSLAKLEHLLLLMEDLVRLNRKQIDIQERSNLLRVLKTSESESAAPVLHPASPLMPSMSDISKMTSSHPKIAQPVSLPHPMPARMRETASAELPEDDPEPSVPPDPSEGRKEPSGRFTAGCAPDMRPKLPADSEFVVPHSESIAYEKKSNGTGLIHFGLRIGVLVSTLLLAAFFAFVYFAQDYGYISENLAFLCFMSGIVPVVYFAVRDNVEFLMIVALLAIGTIPFLSTAVTQNLWVFYCFLLLSALLTLVIAQIKRWRILNGIAFFYIWMLYLFFCQSYKNDMFLMFFLFLSLFYLIFSMIPVWRIFRCKEEMRKFDLILLVFNLFLFLLPGYSMLHDFYGMRSPFLVILPAILCGFYLMQDIVVARFSPKNRAYQVFLEGLAALFAVFLAYPLFLGAQAWLIPVWSMEAVLLLYFGRRYHRGILQTVAIFLYLLVLYKVVAWHFVTVVRDGVFPDETVVTAMSIVSFVLCILFGSRFLNKPGCFGEDEIEKHARVYGLPYIFIFIGSGVMFLYLHFEIVNFTQHDFPEVTVPLISLLWTVCIIFVVAHVWLIRSKIGSVRKIKYENYN